MRALLFVAAMLLPQAPAPLTHYRDRARPVLIFTPSYSDQRFLKQVAELTPHTAGLDERQIVVLPFAEREGSWSAPADPVVWPESKLDAARVRATYRIAPGEFTVILVGKDGGEKHRWHAAVSYETLRGLVDAMPMRQDEMRRPPSGTPTPPNHP